MPMKMLNDDIGTNKRSLATVTNNLTGLQQLNNAAFQPYAAFDLSSQCAQYPKNGSTKSNVNCILICSINMFFIKFGEIFTSKIVTTNVVLRREPGLMQK